MSFVRFETGIMQAKHKLPIEGKIYFPNGSVKIVLNTLTKSHDSQMTDFSLNVPDQNELKSLEDALYSTDWQRDTFNSSSDFITPLSFLLQFFKIYKKTNSTGNKKPILIEKPNYGKAIIYNTMDEHNSTYTI